MPTLRDPTERRVFPKSQVQAEPWSPMPPQHQEKPGVKSKVSPKPKYEAPLYKGSGKLKG
jgi:hypothetical protein